jgi:hypothetical protein
MVKHKRANEIMKTMCHPSIEISDESISNAMIQIENIILMNETEAIKSLKIVQAVVAKYREDEE